MFLSAEEKLLTNLVWTSQPELVVKKPPANAGDIWDVGGFDPWVRKIPWRRKWQPTPVFLPGESHGQRSLVGHSSWGPKRMTWLKHTHLILSTVLCEQELFVYQRLDKIMKPVGARAWFQSLHPFLHPALLPEVILLSIHLVCNRAPDVEMNCKMYSIS